MPINSYTGSIPWSNDGSESSGNILGAGTPVSVYAPIIIHGLRTREKEFSHFLLEWGPDDGDDANLTRDIILGKKNENSDWWEGYPIILKDTVFGRWYRFRVSVINRFGWKSATLPIAEDWVYQRAGFDEDDLTRIDEVVNILPNSDFEFDLLDDGRLELPYWEVDSGGGWEIPYDGEDGITRGTFGRLTLPNLVLAGGSRVRSSEIDVYFGRPYALSGYFIQDTSGLANVSFRIVYYNDLDARISEDYVLFGEDGLRVFDSSTWPGGGAFFQRDRVGAVTFPPEGAVYCRVEILNEGTADLWCDDLMLSQSNRVVNYVSWDRESIEAYRDTWQYRRNLPPNGTADFSGIVPIQAFANEDSSVDIKLRWNWVPGNRYTSGFVVLANLANSGIASYTPTLEDHDIALKIADAEARKFDFLGVNPVNRYSFSVYPYAIVQAGMAYGTEFYYSSGVNDPQNPDIDDWIDFQAASFITGLSQPPRTEVRVTETTATTITLQFIVTSPVGEPTTTYYRLQPSGAFATVPLVGGIPTLTVNRDTVDVVVYYYSQGNETNLAESVLQFVIDLDHIPEIIDVDSEYNEADGTAVVYWWADDDTEVVRYNVDGGPDFFIPGVTGNTSDITIAPGQIRRVAVTPLGRGVEGRTVTQALARPGSAPTIELRIVGRSDTTVTVEYEVEGYGDATVDAWSRIGNAGAFSQVGLVGGIPTQVIQRDDRDVYLYYYASGTTTGRTSPTFLFTVDEDRVPQLIDATLNVNPIAGTYYAKWWADDDTDYVEWDINDGTPTAVIGQTGQTTPQVVPVSGVDTINIIPWGPTGSGIATQLFASRPISSNLPPYIVISGAAVGTDGLGEYVTVDVYSYTGDNNLGGVVEYAEANAPLETHTGPYLAHKVYLPVDGSSTFARYRAKLGEMYSTMVVFPIDSDDLPSINASIGLTGNNGDTVRIAWEGDDDTASVVITPIEPAGSPRTYNLTAGIDTEDTIGLDEERTYTVTPYSLPNGLGNAGLSVPLSIYRSAQQALDNFVMTYRLSDVDPNGTYPNGAVNVGITASPGGSVYWASPFDPLTGDEYVPPADIESPPPAPWQAATPNVPGGNNFAITVPRPAEFSRRNRTVHVTSEKGGYWVYSQFIIDPDDEPHIYDINVDPNWNEEYVLITWSSDDDTQWANVYLDGVFESTAIGSFVASGIAAQQTVSFTANPVKNNIEYPLNGKTLSLTNPTVASGSITNDQLSPEFEFPPTNVDPGSITPDLLEESSRKFVSTLEFGALSPTQISWGTGQIVLADGTVYNISANATYNLSGTAGSNTVNYIYFNSAVSTTVLQVTTNVTTASTGGSILIAYAKVAPAGTQAMVIPIIGRIRINQENLNNSIIGANQIQANAVTADKISANAVTADKIAANSVTASKIQAGSIDVTKLAAGTLSADNITAGTISATVSIATPTFTATTIQASGRIILNNGSPSPTIIGYNSGGGYHEVYFGDFVGGPEMFLRKYAGGTTGLEIGGVAGGTFPFTAPRLTVSAPTRFTGNIGFFGTTPIAKPTISGSSGGNAAVASIATALAALGLVTNSIT